MSVGNKPQTYDVFVGGMPDEVTEESLRQKFSAYGEIKYITRMVPDRAKEGAKCAYIKYGSLADAASAYNDNQNLTFGTNKLIVRKGNWEPKENQENGNNGNNYGKINGGSSRGIYKVPVAEKERKIIITHVDTPTLFYAQNYDAQEEISRLHQNLNSFCANAPPITGSPDNNKIYAVKRNAINDQYYRCQVLMVKGCKVEVLFIDYGDRGLKESTEFIDISSSFVGTEPFFASKYVLFGLMPIHTKPLEPLFEAGVEFFKELLRRDGNCGIFTAKIYQTVKGITPVIIETETIDVNQEILDRGFAKKRIETSSSDGGAFLLNGSVNKPLPLSQAAGKRGIGALNLTRPFLRQPTPPIANGLGFIAPRMKISSWQPPTNSTPPESGIGQGDGPPAVDQAACDPRLAEARKKCSLLQTELDTLKSEKENIEQQNQQLKLERDTARSNVESLKEENESLIRQQKDATLSNQLGALLQNITLLRNTRAMFPMESKDDALEMALDMLQSKHERMEENGLGLKNTVQTLMEEHKSAQENIRNLTNMDELPDAIKSRDKKAWDLDTSIDEFLKSASNLQTEADCAIIQAMIDSLKETYEAFLTKSDVEMDSVGAHTAIQAYRHWKETRQADFSEVRSMTDMYLAGVFRVFDEFKSQLKMEDKSPMDKQQLKNVDLLIAELDAGIRNEMSLTDMSKSDDQNVIGLVVNSLLHELKSERDELNKLASLVEEYRLIKDNLQAGFQSKKNADQLMSYRKTLKQLKSKLRHCLADKADIEEGDSSASDVDAEEIDKAISGIREELHQTFISEEQEMETLIRLSDTYWPELVLEHPEIAQAKEQGYCGIVKRGRSIDQFLIEETLPNAQERNVYVSTYNGNPIVIKEYMFDCNVKLRKEQFIKAAEEYMDAIDENCVPLNFIFFSKNDQQTHLVIPKLMTLQEAIQGNLTEHEIHQVLYGVLQGLSALHSRDIVHAAVHPNNVFVGDGTRGILGEFDFSKSPIQRSERPHRAESGLVFLAPETVESGIVTQMSDMYLFGLLAFWLLFPNSSIRDITSNGSPDTTSRSMSEGFCEQVSALLRPDPVLRPTAAQLLQSSQYFRATPTDTPDSHLNTTGSSSPGFTIVTEAIRSPEGDSSLTVNDTGAAESSIEVATAEIMLNLDLNSDNPNKDGGVNVIIEPTASMPSSASLSSAASLDPASNQESQAPAPSFAGLLVNPPSPVAPECPLPEGDEMARSDSVQIISADDIPHSAPPKKDSSTTVSSMDNGGEDETHQKNLALSMISHVCDDDTAAEDTVQHQNNETLQNGEQGSAEAWPPKLGKVSDTPSFSLGFADDWE